MAKRHHLWGKPKMISDEHELAYWENFSDNTQMTFTRYGKIVENPGYRQRFRFRLDPTDPT